jgi:MscS family membrane protein
VVGVRYETTPVQLRSFMAGVRTLLSGHDNVDPASVRVRFVRFGASSLDVDIFAYIFASDANNFLEIQEELLLGVMDIIQQAGAGIALPSHTVYITPDRSDKLTQPIRDYSEPNTADSLH